MTETLTLDKYFLQMAYEEAAKSPDPSNQNGALIVRSANVLVREYNHFPAGFTWDESFLRDRGKKLRYIEHAERNAVFSAARHGIHTQGATLYCPWFACMECARSIIQAGVSDVVGHAERMAMTPERWLADVEEALEYLDACGVRTRFVTGPVGGPRVLVNGEPWQP